MVKVEAQVGKVEHLPEKVEDFLAKVERLEDNGHFNVESGTSGAKSRTCSV
ncbi:hypothetical protein ACTHOQ_16085 [Solibacillus silvestris]|uniref:hypothetical protein n=1 Tax=Solibacillus silvestris TaxID=76853 RepID=UPI003F821FD1